MTVEPLPPGSKKPQANGLLWAPVLHKMAHYKEVCEQWTLSDLCDAHDIIDLQKRAEQRAIAEAKASR